MLLVPCFVGRFYLVEIVFWQQNFFSDINRLSKGRYPVKNGFLGIARIGEGGGKAPTLIFLASFPEEHFGL